MAIAGAGLVSAASGTNATSYETASITPTGGALVLALFTQRIGTQPVGSATCSGCGITWTEVASVTFQALATPLQRVTLFRGSHASPSPGALTFDLGGTTHTTGAWTVAEFTGVDLTQGSQGVVQSTTDRQNGGTQPDNMTLSAFGNAANATVAACSLGGVGVAISNETVDWVSFGTPFAENTAHRFAWLNANDTTPTFSLAATTFGFGTIAVELAAAVAAPSGSSGFHAIYYAGRR